MRLIDADELLSKFLRYYTEKEKDGEFVFVASEIKQSFADMIVDEPTIDAVPVVRCDKCIMHNNCFTEDAFNLCGIENPFCCYGKRMEPQKPPEAVEEDDFFMKRFMRME